MNFIAMAAAILMLIAAVSCVIAESTSSKNSDTGRAFRKIWLRMRGITWLFFVFISCVVLFIASELQSASMPLMWLSVGIFLLSLIVIDWFRIRLVKFSRKHRKKLSPRLLLPETPLYKKWTAMSRFAGPAPVLEEAYSKDETASE